MKNRKGFTLVELLAVIAILAIIVIFATPKVIELFNNARKSAFDTEIRTLYKQAKSDFMATSITNSSPKKFCDSKTKEIRKDCKELNIDTSSEYLIEVNSLGDIEYIGVDNGTFVYGAQDKITLEDIKTSDIKPKSENNTFSVIDKTITKGLNSNTIKITLNNTYFTNKNDATKVLYISEEKEVPNVRILPTATFNVNISSPSPNFNNYSETCSSTLKGWYTAQIKGIRVIDETGKVIPNVEGYTDSNGKWLKEEDITLYADWTHQNFTVPNIPCTNSIFPYVDWNASYFDGFFVWESTTLEDLVPGDSFQIMYETGLTRRCLNRTTWKLNHNGGTGISSSNPSPVEGQKLFKFYPISERANSEFKGWFVDKALTKQLVDVDSNVLPNVTGYTDENGYWVNGNSSIQLYAGFDYKEYPTCANSSNCVLKTKYSNWDLAILKNTTVTFPVDETIDVFLVGAGKRSGWKQNESCDGTCCSGYVGMGGDGGKIYTQKDISIPKNDVYQVIIGSIEGEDSSFSKQNGLSLSSSQGSVIGTGGQGIYESCQKVGQNCNCTIADNQKGTAGKYGAFAFGGGSIYNVGTRYGNGGKGAQSGAYIAMPGGKNTGDGADIKNLGTSYEGGSGIVIIRNHR